MSFNQNTYPGLISSFSETQSRFFPQYQGQRNDFDFIIIGSGMGGGLLADDLADRLGQHKRILVLEAGSYLFPTHVFNICRFPNASVAARYKVASFYQHGHGGSQNYIHEQPQMNLGGRSIFWSGLIPAIQPWELEFFPDQVKHDLDSQYLQEAGKKMNASVTMGKTAQAIVNKLRQSDLAADFEIVETPRALHQPYLEGPEQQAEEHFTEPTGVFNTAELLINQLGLPGQHDHNGNGLYLLLNHYVEDIQLTHDQHNKLIVRNTLNDHIVTFYCHKLVLAGGSIESPKLLKRSSLIHTLQHQAQDLIGRGLTDHPTTDWVGTTVSHIDGIPIPRNTHAKIIFYSKGERDHHNQIKFPFNVEMNINHEYWHLRENDREEPAQSIYPEGDSIMEIKFSFGHCLFDDNEIKPAPPYQYVPEIVFKNLNWTDHLTQVCFPALAGWQKNAGEVFTILNQITQRIFTQFRLDGQPVSSQPAHPYGQNYTDFGFGTVHHAVGTLRMPYKLNFQDSQFNENSVVDQHLKINGTPDIYVCDMSVIPFSSAANPVRTLGGLALRLSRHLG
ncbi:MAG: GMC oxidoreductase [Candidatus Cyclobacteriaceae bacterium M3_2C_046]